jgi:hypothetical protein
LVYPLLRGRDVSRWQAIPSAYTLVTHQPGMGLTAIPENEMAGRFPKTYAYLKRFETDLRRRSGYRRYFKESDPFYSMFNVGDYTFAPYKVLWREVSNDIQAAVVKSPSHGDELTIPDHTLVAVATDSYDEAQFLCEGWTSKSRLRSDYDPVTLRRNLGYVFGEGSDTTPDLNFNKRS